MSNRNFSHMANRRHQQKFNPLSISTLHLIKKNNLKMFISHDKHRQLMYVAAMAL